MYYTTIKRRNQDLSCDVVRHSKKVGASTPTMFHFFHKHFRERTAAAALVGYSCSVIFFWSNYQFYSDSYLSSAAAVGTFRQSRVIILIAIFASDLHGMNLTFAAEAARNKPKLQS